MRPGLSEPLNTLTALNCKAGDLAIVVATELPENMGQIVEVLGLPTGKPITLTGKGHVWHVRAVSGRATLVYRFNAEMTYAEYGEGPVPDRCLRPVSGLADGDAFGLELAKGRSTPSSTPVRKVIPSPV